VRRIPDLISKHGGSYIVYWADPTVVNVAPMSRAAGVLCVITTRETVC